MKISEMSNDRAADTLIRLSVPFGNICDDEKIVAMIDKYTKAKNDPFIRTVGRILPEIIAYAFKEHKTDLYEIVGALAGEKTEEVGKMNFMETVKIIKDSYDEVLHGFFTSSVSQISDTAEKQSAS